VAQGYAISFPQPPEELDFAAIDDRAAPMLPPGLTTFSG
jgi:hypothetical protein